MPSDEYIRDLENSRVFHSYGYDEGYKDGYAKGCKDGKMSDFNQALIKHKSSFSQAEEDSKVLDKIRAEIEKEVDTSNRLYGISEIGLRKALKIIDKYKAESEVAKT